MTAEGDWRAVLPCAVCGVAVTREAAISVPPFSSDPQVFERFVCSPEHERAWRASAGRRWAKTTWARHQRADRGGRCRQCGDPTKFDAKAGRPHRLCHRCQLAALIVLRRKRKAVRRAIVEALWRRGEPWAEIQRRARLTQGTRPSDLRSLGYDLPPRGGRREPPRVLQSRASRRAPRRPAPAPMVDVDERARAAYEAWHAEHVDGALGWDALPEWKREAWRCEVDESRDPAGIVAAQRGTATR